MESKNIISSMNPSLISLLERPKRPRTAYNYFFQDERARLLAQLPARGKVKTKTTSSKRGSHGKIGFEDLAKTIASKWRAIPVSQMIYYANMANHDKLRYRREMYEFNKQRQQQMANEQEPEETMAKNIIVKPSSVKKEEIRVQQVIAYTPNSEEDIHLPLPLGLSTGPTIADLAGQLDQESIDIIIRAFK